MYYPQQPPPQFPPLPPPQPRRSRTWVWLLLAGFVVIAVVAVTTVVVMGGSDNGGGKAKKEAERRTKFEAAFAEAAPRYAGNAVYDACGLLTLDTVAKDVNNYQELLDRTGAGEDELLTQPLYIDHQYVDRDIPSPLGKDGEANGPGVTIGAQGTVKESFNSYTSLFDTNCEYGQGLSGRTTFAKVFVTQKPRPLALELLSYLGTLTPEKKFGVDIYTEPQKDPNGFFLKAVVKPDKSVAAIIKTGQQQLSIDAAAEAAAALAQAPKGPLELTYPTPFKDLVSACPLITADEFTQYTQKPASSLAQEELVLSEAGSAKERRIRRSCQRLEVDRFTNEVAETDVMITQWKDEDNAVSFAKQQTGLSEPVEFRNTATKVGDESYIKVGRNIRDKETYAFEFRIGAATITLAVNLDQPTDTSAEVYEQRVLPIAQRVAENYKKLMK